MTISIKPTQAFIDFDPFGAGFRANPIAFHHGLLNASPGFMMMEGDVPSTYVARFDHCQKVLADWEAFSSVKPKNMPGMQRVDFFNGQPVMNYSDPPQHDRLRQVVATAFTPGAIAKLAEAADRIIANLLDQIQEGNQLDGVEGIARPITIKLLFDELLGIKPEDQRIFFEFGATLPLLDALKPGDPKPESYVESWKKGEAACRRMLEEAQENQTDNILGRIAKAAESGTMSDAEMMAMMCVLFTGGVPTVSAMCGSVLYYLAEYPDIADRIRQDESLAKAFCEETLRLDAPVTMVMRFANHDTLIGDQEISKGMPVYTMISVANRDPEMYENPNEFNIDRKGKRHFAFGNGVHVCIGNAITRMLLPRLVVEVAKRLPNLRLDTERPVTWETTPRSRHRAIVPLIA